MKKHTPGQLDKYDIDQKIIKTLADLESRTILFSIIRKAKLVEEISKENKILLSTSYKKLNRLEELALVKIEKRIFSEKGYIIKYYKSRINKAQISIKKLKPILILHKN